MVTLPPGYVAVPEEPTGLTPIGDLIRLVEADCGPTGPDDGDDEPVGHFGDGRPLPITFGHIRRARAAFDALATPTLSRGTLTRALRLIEAEEREDSVDGRHARELQRALAALPDNQEGGDAPSEPGHQIRATRSYEPAPGHTPAGGGDCPTCEGRGWLPLGIAGRAALADQKQGGGR